MYVYMKHRRRVTMFYDKKLLGRLCYEQDLQSGLEQS